MAEAVESAVAAGGHLLSEAATGTGKTLAYLVPALMSGKNVVIATATRALQDQVIDKDLPLALKMLAPLELVPRVVVVKGLSNYLCRRRFEEQRFAPSPGMTRAAIERLGVWAEDSPTGDRAELAWVDEAKPPWTLVSASPETRIGPRCPYYDNCFITRMKGQAAVADVIVTNHHVYFADVALRSRFPGAQLLPAHDVVIFDEAQHLEDTASAFFARTVTTRRLARLVRDVERLAHRLEPGRRRELADEVRALEVAVRDLEARAPDFWPESMEGRTALTRSPDPGRVLERFDQALAALAAIDGLLDAEEWTDDAAAWLSVTRRVADACSSWRAIRDSTDAAIRAGERSREAEAFDLAEPPADDTHEPPTEVAGWIERREGGLAFGLTPAAVREALRAHVFERIPTVVCTSATMALANRDGTSSFAYFRSRSGAPDAAQELVVPSPFDWETRAMLYAPTDLPEPNRPGYERAISERLEQLLELTDGGALVLTTSRRQMVALAAHVRRRGAWDVLVQGEGSHRETLARFREHGRAVLVATMGFWEGVDVPGDALRLVTIDRLPFPVPTDPIFSARARDIERRGGSPFMDFAVPLAATTLKQGVGRLIRAPGDWGMVALLDSRARTKAYGKRILRALPPLPISAAWEDIEAFWARQARRATSTGDNAQGVTSK